MGKEIACFQVIPGCDENASKTAILNSMHSVNSARQFGISLAAQLTPKPAWILPLDGNSFITKEALIHILRALVPRDKFEMHKYRGIAMFRSLGCQESIINDNFSLLNHLEKIDPKDFDKQPVISEYLTKKDEGQVAVSTKARDLHKVFQSNLAYGNDSKYELIKRLNRKRATPRSTCLFANYIRKTSLEKTKEDIKECGYVIRLQYWPENSCNVVRDNMSDIRKLWIFEEVVDRPEFTSRVRERLRKTSIGNLADQAVVKRETIPGKSTQ